MIPIPILQYYTVVEVGNEGSRDSMLLLCHPCPFFSSLLVLSSSLIIKSMLFLSMMSLIES